MSYKLRDSKDGWVLFQFKDVYIYVKCYDDKKVGRILYDTERASGVDPKEFLALNSGGNEWVAVTGKPYNYETKNGQLRASLNGSRLEIWTSASEKLEQAQKAARDAHLKKDALKGF
jgi:hypothetical protein